MAAHIINWWIRNIHHVYFGCCHFVGLLRGCLHLWYRLNLSWDFQSYWESHPFMLCCTCTNKELHIKVFQRTIYIHVYDPNICSTNAKQYYYIFNHICLASYMGGPYLEPLLICENASTNSITCAVSTCITSWARQI